MWIRKQKLWRCLLTALLVSLTLSSPCGAEWKVVPAGWTSEEAGYFGTLEDGRDTLAALQTYRLTAQRWEAAHEDLRAEFVRNSEQVKADIIALEAQINEERKAWKAEVARARTRNVIWVVLAGAAGYAIGR
ncbi:hypothetical protein FACS1894204_05690 [Synergistales bacterium]|nr:hypothetical protein FACS1894204_05690 [Synergistales bacterium]